MTKLEQLKIVREKVDRAIEAEIRRTERATLAPDAEELFNQMGPEEKATPPGKYRLHLIRTNHQRVVRHRSAAPIDTDSTPKPPAC
jgi:hypothetical protein